LHLTSSGIGCFLLGLPAIFSPPAVSSSISKVLWLNQPMRPQWVLTTKKFILYYICYFSNDNSHSKQGSTPAIGYPVSENSAVMGI
jgi:hypothetical protein